MTNPVARPPASRRRRGRSLGAQAWQRLRRNRAAMGGAAFLVVLALVSFLAPALMRGAAASGEAVYNVQNRDLGASPPSAAHWLGTDELGRDNLVRILYGGRVSLSVAFIATGVAVVVGVTVGAGAGFVGGRCDAVIMRTVDVMYALPFPIFVIVLMVFFGRHLLLLFLAIGAVEWLTMARIVRAEVLSLRGRPFVDAASALGYGRSRILLRHIVPNALGPIVVYATLTVPNVILLEAFISFLGLGVQPPLPSWGSLIGEGALAMEESPWLLVFPGLCMTLTLFALNFLGDGLRDALDPRDTGRAGSI